MLHYQDGAFERRAHQDRNFAEVDDDVAWAVSEEEVGRDEW